MVWQSNTDYCNNSFYSKVSAPLVAASLIAVGIASIWDKELESISSAIPHNYSEYVVDYSSSSKTTSQDSIVKNDIGMLKTMEIANYINIINNKFHVDIDKFWIPADKILDKTCLFFKLKNHHDIIKQYAGDLELDIYLALQNELKNSQFFNMVALY